MKSLAHFGIVKRLAVTNLDTKTGQELGSTNISGVEQGRLMLDAGADNVSGGF